MKFSLNTVKAFNQRYGCVGDIAPDGVEALIAKVGAQLGAIDAVTDVGTKYQGVVAAKVVSCVKHPNADKLSICAIDDSGITPGVKRDANGYVQVVCGAPNVRAGLLVAWLPPGSTVPNTVDKEPFVLEAREIRGEISQGMLASPRELALGDSHAGILEIDGDIKPGTPFAEAFNLTGDVIIDIENKMFTHRPDLFGFLGVARELAGIQGLAFESPDWYTPAPAFLAIEAEELPLTVKNDLPKLVPRFTALTLRDVQVGPSPVWLQVELAKIGQKSINNIVDYTNWFMLETGQPIHAYDYDKVQSVSGGDHAVLTVRHPKPGEKIKLLNGKTIEPRAEAMMVAAGDKLIGLGGAMGGTETEIDSETTNVIIEAASWNMFNMRRTSMEHGIFTEAVTRFTKGQSPRQNLVVVARIVDEIRQHAGGKLASQTLDIVDGEAINLTGFHDAEVAVTPDFITSRLGLELTAEQIATLLKNVEFSIEKDGESLTVGVPFWRTDIELREDVVEEVGRLYGYDKLPLELPRRDLTPAVQDPLLSAKAKIRATLAKAGANEVLTYSFVPGSLLDKTGQDQAQAFQVANALSPDLQYYRLSLMPSLLDKVHPNIKAGYDRFALFELGKTHSLDHADDDQGLPREFEFTALVVTAADKLKPAGSAYYQARKYLQALVDGFTTCELVFKPIGKDMLQYPVVQPYDAARSALVSIKPGGFLGIIGEFKPSVSQALKLPAHTAGFEVDTTAVQALAAGSSYRSLSRFPSLWQDITLTVAADLPYAELAEFVNQQLQANAPEATQLQLDPVDIYQKADDPAHKHCTFRVTVTSANRTLTDKEVSQALDLVAEAAGKQYFDKARADGVE